MCSRMFRPSILSLLHTFIPLLAPLATLPLFGSLTSAGTNTRGPRVPWVCIPRDFLRNLGTLYPRCHVLPLRSHPCRISPAWTPACRLLRQLSVRSAGQSPSGVRRGPRLAFFFCWYLSRMLTAAVGLHTAHRGSGWIRGAPHATPEIVHWSFLTCCAGGRVLPAPHALAP
jgi:hypothetical protein